MMVVEGLVPNDSRSIEYYTKRSVLDELKSAHMTVSGSRLCGGRVCQDRSDHQLIDCDLGSRCIMYSSYLYVDVSCLNKLQNNDLLYYNKKGK